MGGLLLILLLMPIAHKYGWLSGRSLDDEENASKRDGAKSRREERKASRKADRKTREGGARRSDSDRKTANPPAHVP